MINCTNGHQNLDDASFCETCGVSLQRGGRKNFPFIIGLAIALVGGAIALYFMTPSTEDALVPRNLLEKLENTGLLTVGVEPDAAPFNYIQEGERTGFDYEIIHAIVKEMGNYKVDFNETYYYDELPDKAKAAEFDIFMGGYVPDPEIEDVTWSESYLDFGLCLVVAQGSAIENISQLRGKKVGIYEGDNVARTWVEENVSGIKEIKEYTDDGEVNWMECILKGEVDAVIYDYPFAQEEIKEFEELKIVQLNLNDSKYAIGIPGKNNFKFLAKINIALRKVKESPLYGEIIRKYLKSEQIDVADIKEDEKNKVYEVKKGDTLGSIAASELGDKNRWQELFDANKERIPNKDLIFPGDKLLIPR